MTPEPFQMDVSINDPVPSMLSRALLALVEKYGDQMICAADERHMDGRFGVEVKLEIDGGPCSGRWFRLEFSLEPEGEVITH